MQTNTNPNRFVFGAARGNLTNSTGNAGTQAKAQYWLNVGYSTGHEKLDFVSLPMGIPMDAADKKELRGDPNSEIVQFLQAGNDLFDEVMAEAENLAPGEATIITIPLQIQLRRVKSDVDASQVDRTNNPFRRPTAPAAPAAQEATPAVAQQEVTGDPVF